MGPYLGDSNCPEEVFWPEMAGKLNARSASPPALIMMADANANLRSTKFIDVNHRAAFEQFLIATGLREATLADTTGRHITYSSVSCPEGVQNDFLAVRGLVRAFDDEAQTRPQFTSMAAGEDHIMLSVPVQLGHFRSRSLASRRSCALQRGDIMLPDCAMEIRRRLANAFVCARHIDPSSDYAVMAEQVQQILCDVCPKRSSAVLRSSYMTEDIFYLCIIRALPRAALDIRDVVFVMNSFVQCCTLFAQPP